MNARLLAPCCCPCCLVQHGLAADAASQTREINYLLEFVASSGCTFIRNGDDHDSAEAADHLRLKYSRGKRYVNSAEQFIDRLATASSWSGDPYTVTCAGHHPDQRRVAAPRPGRLSPSRCSTQRARTP